MRIEISAGGLSAGVAVGEYQAHMAGFVSHVDDIISGFKAVAGKTEDLPGGVGNLQGAVEEIEQRIRQEEEKKEAAVTVRKKTNDFLELAMRVDKQVAHAVNKNRNEFYKTNPWLKPALYVDGIPWYEHTWDWLCDKGEKVAEGIKKGWDWLKDTAGDAWDWLKDTGKKAWNWAKDFYQEHWDQIINWGVTILCAVGSIVAIALIPVTGGASLLLIAGISAVSGAVVAATQSITSQIKETGTVDWGKVGKEATIAAVVGGVTGAIGAGLGGAITSALSHTGIGASLLTSSSTAVRMLTGAAIGSASEVASGVATRGAAEATESYLETGNVEFGDVLDAAFDPQQMALDAAIGGASGGFGAAKTPNANADAAPADTTDWDRTSNTASEEEFLRELAASGDLETTVTDPSLSDPLKRSAHLPQKSGAFSGEIGNSKFVPNDSAALARMQEFGADGVIYVNNDVDFSPFTKHDSPWGVIEGKVEIGHMTDQRTNGQWEFGRRPSGTSHDPAYDLGNFAQADNAVAKQFEGVGITGKDIERFRTDNHLIWHESADGKTMMLVPEEIHKACPHSGGVSEMKYRMAWGDIKLNY